MPIAAWQIDGDSLAPTTASPSPTFWRGCLYLHLAIAIATAILLWCEAHGVDLPVGFGIGFGRLVGYGGIFVTAAPFVTLYLLSEGLRTNRRYFVIAAADVLISAAQLFAVWPLIH